MSEQMDTEGRHPFESSQRARPHTVRLNPELYAQLQRRARAKGMPAADVLEAILVQAFADEEALGAPRIERLLRSIEDRTRTLEALLGGGSGDRHYGPFHTRLYTSEGARFEDFDRFHLIAAVAYLRDLARHFIPKMAATAEDRAESELVRLYGEKDDGPAQPAPAAKERGGRP